jgi:hypothetical protein
MEFLNFEPSEFIVLEDAIEFDETVQRAESVRFYTLDEQEADAYEKLIPKGRVTQFQRDEVKKEIHRIRELYETYVVPTADDYILREPSSGKIFDWVHPVYASPDLKPYNFETSWASLFENPRAPNFYPRMAAAMPRPFAESTQGVPYPVSKATEFVNADGQKPHRVLPVFTVPKTVVHSDKTIDILLNPIEGTADVVNFVGYSLEKRPLDIPNPLPEHPFLKENKPAFVETTASLDDVAPSIDAILTHAVPSTTDPYRVALPYLKLYDVKLSNIPWSSWKSKFPQAEMEQGVREKKPIEFQKTESQAPGEKIVTTYGVPYTPGVSAREWLMRQDDGGEFVVRALLSKAIDNGSVESIPGIDLPVPAYPNTTLAECDLMGLGFQDFNLRGILRRTWGKGLQCVPLEFLKQERARAGYLNRLPWTDSTASEILDKHIKALRRYRAPVIPVKKIAEIKTPAKSESQSRVEVLSVMADPRRHVIDKVRDTQELLKDLTLTNNIYTDAEGLFVFCSHTLAVLMGDMAADRRKFYDTWTAPVDGFRVCKFCGEQVSGLDLVDQEEYNEDGFVIRHTSSLDTPGFAAGELGTFTTGLQALRPLFDMEIPSDAVMFLLLSLLQVLPKAETVNLFIMAGREIVRKLGTKESDALRRAKGAVGIATAALLLQAHIPILVPRRSFGSRPLKLNGYPRDLSEPEKYSIIDVLMMVIENTYRAYPSTLAGPTQQIIRGILNTPRDIYKTVKTLIDRELLTKPHLRTLLESAKTYQAGLPIVEEPTPLIGVQFPPETFGTVTQYEACPSLRPILGSPTAPAVSQPAVPLRTPLMPADSAKKILPSLSERVEVAGVEKAAIQKRIGLEKAAKVKAKDPYRANLTIASRISDMFELPVDVRTVDPTQKPAELRDIGRGFVYEVFATLQKDPVKVAKFNEARSKDVALYTLLADYKEEKAQSLKLRATERLNFVNEMAQRTDMEREIIGDLLKIGLAPYIITNRDRAFEARQAEALQDILKRKPVEEEVGVGKPQDQFDQGDETAAGTDNGNYGDYLAVPINDGRDYEQPSITDDTETSI